MKCNCCKTLYNTTIIMQTVGGHGMICHTCIEKGVRLYIMTRKEGGNMG